jgi:hypothetical protein
MILGAPGGEIVPPGTNLEAPGALMGGHKSLIFLVNIDNSVKASEF